ncbi:MAG: hypothetical protein Q8O48_09950 [Anaerolineales bacterium]|nr:hypothetical protein [Anaerolineales bacterium]
MKRFVLPLLLTVTLILAACAPSQTTPLPPSGTSQTDLQPFDPTQGKPAAVSTETPQAEAGDLTRSDQQGAVTVEVTPLNLDDPSEQIEFDVVLDTHSVDLSMDLATLATLTTDTGATVQATVWDAPRGGHHVAGKLIFPATQESKSILDGATMLTLTIVNVDAPSRIFEWELK